MDGYILIDTQKGKTPCDLCAFKNNDEKCSEATECLKIENINKHYEEIDEFSPLNIDPDMKIFNTSEI